MYASTYIFMIYILHMYHIFCIYSYDIVVDYISFLLFVTNIMYCQFNNN